MMICFNNSEVLNNFWKTSIKAMTKETMNKTMYIHLTSAYFFSFTFILFIFT